MKHITLSPPANLESMTNEGAFQRLVVDALRTMGWVVIHIKEMFGNPKGIPDLLCFRDAQGQMIELKVHPNCRFSPGQNRWIERWVPEGTSVMLVCNREEDWRAMMEVMQP